LANSILLPVLSYGMSFEHIDYSLTVSVDTNTYHDLIMSMLNSIAEPGRFLVLINAHGGNSNMASVVEADYNYRHSDVKIYHRQLFSEKIYKLSKDLLGEFDTHAGSVEASLLSYYNKQPKQAPTTNKDFIKPLPSALRFFRNAEIGSTGVIKGTDTINIDPIAGQKIHEAIVKEMVTEIKSMSLKINKQIHKLQK